MFEDVAQMEKEIEKFRENIIASSELVEGIKGLTEATRKHEESYTAATEELLKKLDDSVVQIEADHENALNTLSNRVDSAIAEQHEKSAKDLADRVAEIEKIKTSIEEYQSQAAKNTDEQIQQLLESCEHLITEMKTELDSQQSAYVEKLKHTEQAISGYQAAAEKKYDEFVNRLEATNVDQIFKEVQDLKQSINTKFMILMGGVGAAIVVAIVDLIMK